MHRYEKRLIAAVVTLPLVAVLIGAPLVAPDTGDLNRNPVPFPDVSARDMLDAEAYGNVGAWLRDRVPFRRHVRYVDTKIDRGVFRDVDNPMIVQGRDGWLFFEPALALGLAPEFDPADVRAGILRLKTEVEAAGKTFLFAFGPHKPTIYPDYLSDRDQRRQARVRERLEAFRDLMRREPVDGFIDGWDELEAARADAPEPLYYPRDTHWTPLGSAPLARRIVDALEPGLSASLEMERGRARKYIPDLVKFAGLEQTETIHVWKFSRAGVETDRAEVETGEKTRTRQFAATAETGTSLLPRIAVICDSYGTSMHRSLSQFFETTTFIHMQSGDTELAKRALAEADIVLFLRVERFLWGTSEDTPFAGDSAEVLGLLESIRRRTGHTAFPGLTGPAARFSGGASITPGGMLEPGAGPEGRTGRMPFRSAIPNSLKVDDA